MSVTLAGNNRTIGVNYRSEVFASSNPFAVEADSLDHFSIAEISSPQVTGAPFELSITALDRFENVIGGFVGDVSLTTTAGTIAPEVMTFAEADSGRHTGLVTVTASGGGYTITVSDQANHTATSNPFAVNAATIGGFAFEAIPSPQTAGQPFELIILALTEQGNRMSTFTGPVTLVTTAGTITPEVMTFAEADSGRHTGLVTVTASGEGHTIAASDQADHTGTSNPFTVYAATVDRFAFEAIPSPQTARQPFELAILALTEQGHRMSNYTGPVTLATNAGTITPAVLTFSMADSGRHVERVSVTRAGSGERIEATDDSGHTGISGPFDVKAGPAVLLAFVQQPGGGVGGAPLTRQPIVGLFDANANRATESAAEITVALLSPDSVAVHGTTRVGTDEGVASFTDLEIDKAGSGYVLSARSPGFEPALSDSFEVTFGPAAQLAFSVQPHSGFALKPLEAPPEISILDAGGNTVTNSALSIRLSLDDDPYGAVLHGTLERLADQGKAAFLDVAVDKAGSGYRLRASTSELGIESCISAAFDILPGGPTTLVFLTQPGTGEAGVPLAQQPAIAVHDAAGNQVVSSNVRITLALESNPGSGTLSGDLSGLATGGVLRFESVSIDKGASGYRLTGLSDGLTSAVSETFDVQVGPPTKLAFLAQPDSGVGGGALTPQPVIEIQDRGGNRIAAPVEVTISIGSNPAGGGLRGNAVIPAVGGVTVFEGLGIDKAGSGYTLMASAPGFSSAICDPFSVRVGSPARLEFTVQPGDGKGGATLDRRPAVAITDASGNRVVEDGRRVTLDLVDASGAATLLGLTSRSSFGGMAVFDSIGVDKVGTDYILVARAAHLVEALSQPFDVTRGDPAKMSALSGEGMVGIVGSWLPERFSVQVTDAGNNALSEIPIHFAISSAPEDASGQVLEATETPTDSTGCASVRLRLGDHEGTYSVMAILPDLPEQTIIFDVLARGPDGTGTAILNPAWTITGSEVDLTLMLSGDGRATNATVRVEVPAEWKWPGRPSDLRLDGEAFVGSTASIEKEGSETDPYVVTVSHAQIAREKKGLLTILGTTAPDETGSHSFAVSTAAHLGELASIEHAPSIAVYPIVPGDADLDRRVDVLDVLWAVDFLLGHHSVNSVQRRAVDVFPEHAASGSQGPRDGRIERSDIDLLKRAILNQAWEDGLALGASESKAAGEIQPGSAALESLGGLAVAERGRSTLPQRPPSLVMQDASSDSSEIVVLTFARAEGGIAVRLENRIPIRGIQLNLSLGTDGPSEIQCRKFERTGQLDLIWQVARGQHRILLIGPANESIDPGDGPILWIGTNPAVYEFDQFQVVVGNVQNLAVDVVQRWSEDSALPAAFRLDQNYPNPFGDRTSVSFASPRFARIRIEIIDLAGRRIRNLYDRESDPGEHVVSWNGTDDSNRRVACGIYLCLLTSGRLSESRKLVLLK